MPLLSFTTTPSFVEAVDRYQSAVNSRNALVKRIDKSNTTLVRAVVYGNDDGADDKNVSLTEEDRKILRAAETARLCGGNGSASSSRPLAPSTASVLGYQGIGYSGGVYTHPRIVACQTSPSPSAGGDDASVAAAGEKEVEAEEEESILKIMSDRTAGVSSSATNAALRCISQHYALHLLTNKAAMDVKFKNVLELIVAKDADAAVPPSSLDGLFAAVAAHHPSAPSTSSSSANATEGSSNKEKTSLFAGGCARLAVVADCTVPVYKNNQITTTATMPTSSIEQTLEAVAWAGQRHKNKNGAEEGESADDAASSQKEEASPEKNAETVEEKPFTAPDGTNVFYANVSLFNKKKGEEGEKEADDEKRQEAAPIPPISLLGNKDVAKALVQDFVNGMGFDVVVAVVDGLANNKNNKDAAADAVVQNKKNSKEEQQKQKAILFKLLQTIAAVLSKDRSAAAYIIFTTSTPPPLKNDGDDDEGSIPLLLDALCELVGLDFFKVDEATVSDSPQSSTSSSTPPLSTTTHCYKLHLRWDEAGLPLDPFAVFDAVIQGTGMTESFLSAALARAGKRVLHLDAGACYGGAAFASIDLGAFHRQYCLPLRADGSYADGYSSHFYGGGSGGGVAESSFADVKANLKINKIFKQQEEQQKEESGTAASSSTNALPISLLSDREVRQVMIDAVPMFSFARGPLINTLVDGRAGRNLEFMTVDRVVLLEPTTTTSATAVEQSTTSDSTTTATAAAAAATSAPPPTSASSSLAARRALLAAKKMAKSAVDTVAAAATNAAASAAGISLPTPSTAAASSSKDGCRFTPKLVPFSRSDVFKGGNHLFSNPLEARRAMKFFKDLEKSFDHTANDSGNENELEKRAEAVTATAMTSSHEEGAKEEGKGSLDDGTTTTKATDAKTNILHSGLKGGGGYRILCADGETYRRALPWEDPSQDQKEPLEAFLSRHYGLSAATIDLLTMGGALVPATRMQAATATTSASTTTPQSSPFSTSLSSAINLIRTSLASVGRFGVGETPLLCAMYGSGEVPQNMCRIAAVWDATFILRRCVRGLSMPTATSAGDMEEKEKSSNEEFCSVRLSNGQCVRTRALILPKELSNGGVGGSGGLLRAVLVVSQPLLSWCQLETHCNDHPPTDDSVEHQNQKELREYNQFPVMLGVLKVAVKAHSAAEDEGKHSNNSESSFSPIIIHQFGASTGHCPQTVKERLNPASDDDDDSKPPQRLCVIHFTADIGTMTRETFEAAIEALMGNAPLPRKSKKEKKAEKSEVGEQPTPAAASEEEEQTASPSTAVTTASLTGMEGEEEEGGSQQKASPSLLLAKDAVLYYATFVLDAARVARKSVGGEAYYFSRDSTAACSRAAASDSSSSWKELQGALPLSVALSVVKEEANFAKKDLRGIFHTSSLLVPSTSSTLASSTAGGEDREKRFDDDGDAGGSKEMKTLRASAVPSLLNDSSSVCEAVALYHSIMRHLLFSPSSSSASPSADDTQPQHQRHAPRRKVFKFKGPYMPFLYKLPDPTGRDSDDEDDDDEEEGGGLDEDAEDGTTYAHRLLSEASA